MGNSAHCQSSPKNGPLPDASSIKCDGLLFLFTYFKLCHVRWRRTILLRRLGEQQSPRRPLLGCRRPFVRNDIIANGVSPISGVRRSWKIVIYRLHCADLYYSNLTWHVLLARSGTVAFMVLTACISIYILCVW